MKPINYILMISFVILSTLNAWHYYPMPSWVEPMVEEVAQQFNAKTPTIYQEMCSVRAANPHLRQTCTDIRRSPFFGDLIIGDRLIQKLHYQELKLLTRRAFISYKNWYRFK